MWWARLLNQIAAIHGIGTPPAPPWTPADLTLVRGWYDAADTATISVSGTAVTQWNDKSSYGKNLTQGAAGSRPTSGVTTLNSENVITFDGGDFLGAATASDWTFLNDGTDYLIGFVAKFGNVANPDTYMGLINTKGSVSAPGVDFYHDTRVSRARMEHLVTNASSGTFVVQNATANVVAANDWFYGTLLADPNNGTAANRSKIYYEAGTAAANNVETAAVSAAPPTRALEVGRYSNDFGNLTGGVAEIVIAYGADATNDNRLLLNTYLKDKWAL
jgi:hypothetical protein